MSIAATKTRPSRRIAADRSLRFESLAKRELMAADVSLSGGLLSIDGDAASDTIVIHAVFTGTIQSGKATSLQVQPVQIAAPPSIEVRVTNRYTGQTDVEHFASKYISRLEVLAGGGNDIVDNRTDLPSTLRGESGVDRIYGGEGDDVIFGGSGRDTSFDFEAVPPHA